DEYGNAALKAACNMRAELQVQKEKMGRMFCSSLVNNNFHVAKTLRKKGPKQASLAAGSILNVGEGKGLGLGVGSLLGGLSGLIGGTLLGKAIDKIGENIQKSIQLSYVRGDTYKTGAAPGQNYRHRHEHKTIE